MPGQALQPQSPQGADRSAHCAARDKRRRMVIIALLSTLGALTLSCALAIVYLIIPHPKQRLLPEGAGIPPLEIVFYADDADFGFIHPDGSGYVTRDLQISRGFWRTAWKPLTWNTWSPDGRYLAVNLVVHNPSGEEPILISTAGDIIRCPNETPAPYVRERFWVVRDMVILASTHGRIFLFDMATCREVATLYGPIPNEGASQPALSSQGWLAFRHSTASRDDVLVLDEHGAPQASFPMAIEPAWSPDGEFLAYCLFHGGLYTARKDGGEKTLIFPGPTVSSATWSPDGKWLIYTRYVPSLDEEAIFKFEIATGEETLIFEGGSSPQWREVPPAEADTP
jgi:hypothetical protein